MADEFDSEQENETRPFWGGISTEMELEMLKKHYQDPKVGDRLSDDELEKVIKQERSTNRFKTIMDRYRKYLFKVHNLLLLRDRMVGYYIADEDQRVDHMIGQEKKGSRCYKKAIKVGATTDRDKIPKDKRAAYDFHINYLSRVEQGRQLAMREHRMKMLSPVKAK
jgi:hypothetical protein